MEYGDEYRFDLAALDALRAAGVDWRDVQHVLRTNKPKIRYHIGSVLRVIAQDRSGGWMVVALIEEEDDAYLVVRARYLDQTEVEAARRVIGGDHHDGKS